MLLPTPRARVFLDLVQSGRTVATEAIDVEDGVGRWAFDVDGSLEGALQLDAYFLGENSEIVRDRRLVYVDPADALDVRLTPDLRGSPGGDTAASRAGPTWTAGASVCSSTSSERTAERLRGRRAGVPPARRNTPPRAGHTADGGPAASLDAAPGPE